MLMIHLLLTALSFSENEETTPQSLEVTQVEEVSTESEANVEEASIELVANTDFLEGSSSVFPETRVMGMDLSEEQLLSQEKYKRSNDVLIYGSLELVLPGGGLALRVPAGNLMYEGNFSLLLLAAKCSFSVLYPFSDSQTYWYCGGGVGVGSFLAVACDDPILCPYIPVFIGYRGMRFFSDIGLDLLLGSFPFPVPTFRCGMCF